MRKADAVAATTNATKLKARTRENTDWSIAAMQKFYGNACKSKGL